LHHDPSIRTGLVLFLEPSFYGQISYQTAITPLSQSGYGFWQASARSAWPLVRRPRTLWRLE